MSDTRIPTFNLRFVERNIRSIDPGFYGNNRPKMRVLQQMLETTSGKRFWEDVPLITDREFRSNADMALG